jgi:hypothetical protein
MITRWWPLLVTNIKLSFPIIITISFSTLILLPIPVFSSTPIHSVYKIVSVSNLSLSLLGLQDCIGIQFFFLTLFLSLYLSISLLGLQDCIGMSVSHPTWQRTRPLDPEDTHNGWVFCEENTVLQSPAG